MECKFFFSILQVLREAVPSIATLLAAFSGAWFAYRLQDKQKAREQRATNISSANRALFTIFQQINTLRVFQDQIIDPVRNHSMRFIAMQPILEEKCAEINFNFPSLEFLLNTKQKQLLPELFIEQQRFFAAIKAINIRSELHIQAQPILEHAGIQEGVDYFGEELRKKLWEALGERRYKLLERATDQAVYHVDKTLVSLISVKGKMISTFKDLFPEGDFLNFELLERPN